MTAAPVAIVTAAGRGIGAACAHELAARGYRLALMSPSDRSVRLADELGGIGLQGSVTRPEDIDRLVQATMDAYGRIDAVVANTGDPDRADLLDLTDDQLLGALDLIFLNVVRMARAITPMMLAQGGGA